MNFDEASEKIPYPVRQFLETTLVSHGLKKDDPVVSVALVQAYLTEVIEKRRRRAVYWATAALLVVVAIGSSLAGYEIGKSAFGASILKIKGEHRVETIFVDGGNTYVKLK